MPSLRSHLFRAAARLVAMRMNVFADWTSLRAFMSAGAGRPTLPRGTRWERIRANGVAVEWITLPNVDPNRVLLYLHGGGWVLGLYNNHRWMSAQIGQACGARVLAVDYRLAPEHPFPAALDDCLAAYRWLLQNKIKPENVIIGGDSAGGTLTLTTLLALRDAGDPLPAAGVCLSPVTDLTCTGETFWTKRDPMLEPALLLRMIRDYAGPAEVRQPLLSPLVGDLRGLPPLLIHAGEGEILLSDATRLAERARNAGVNVTLKVWPAMWHVWHMFTPFLPEAKHAIDQIGAFVNQAMYRA